MVFSPDKVKHISAAQLAKLGAMDIDLRGIKFDPEPGARGVQASMKVLIWQATITPKAADRPMIRAIREDPDEADHDARTMFVQMMGKKPGEFTETVSTPAEWTAAAKAKAPPKPKPRPAVDEVDDMI